MPDRGPLDGRTFARVISSLASAATSSSSSLTASTDVAEATDLARRIVETVSSPIEFDGLVIRIGAAVGVALTLDGPEEPLRLLARADAAMYRAKSHDRSAIEIFDADLQRAMVEREDVESALSLALTQPSGGGLAAALPAGARGGFRPSSSASRR